VQAPVLPVEATRLQHGDKVMSAPRVPAVQRRDTGTLQARSAQAVAVRLRAAGTNALAVAVQQRAPGAGQDPVPRLLRNREVQTQDQSL